VPVWFDITGPWSRYGDPRPGHEETGAKMMQACVLALHLTVLFTGLVLAQRNLKLGRGDKRGAFRLAVFFSSLDMVGWFMAGSHVLSHLQASFDRALAESLKNSLISWVLYLGFEPHVRRLWPKRIIAWNRLLAGRLRDPLVGRDMLVGCLLGLGIALLAYA